MITHSFPHGIGRGFGLVSLEDGANALEEMAGDCGALLDLDLFVQCIGVCRINSSSHHAVD